MLPEEVVVFYTDGLTEARSSEAEDIEFGLEKLIDVARLNSAYEAPTLTEKIIQDIRENWLGTDQEDDWTLLVLKRQEVGDTGFEPVTSTV